MIAAEQMDSGANHTSAQVVGGFLAAAAIFAGVAALVSYPGRIGPAAIVIALIAAGLSGGSNKHLAAVAMWTAVGGFFVGMIISVVLDRPIF